MKWFLVTLAAEMVVLVVLYHFTKRLVSKLFGRIRDRFRRRMENPRPVFDAEKDVYFNREYARPHDRLKKSA